MQVRNLCSVLNSIHKIEYDSYSSTVLEYSSTGIQDEILASRIGNTRVAMNSNIRLVLCILASSMHTDPGGRIHNNNNNNILYYELVVQYAY